MILCVQTDGGWFFTLAAPPLLVTSASTSYWSHIRFKLVLTKSYKLAFGITASGVLLAFNQIFHFLLPPKPPCHITLLSCIDTCLWNLHFSPNLAGFVQCSAKEEQWAVESDICIPRPHFYSSALQSIAPFIPHAPDMLRCHLALSSPPLHLLAPHLSLVSFFTTVSYCTIVLSCLLYLFLSVAANFPAHSLQLI